MVSQYYVAEESRISGESDDGVSDPSVSPMGSPRPVSLGPGPNDTSCTRTGTYRPSSYGKHELTVSPMSSTYTSDRSGSDDLATGALSRRDDEVLSSARSDEYGVGATAWPDIGLPSGYELSHATSLPESPCERQDDSYVSAGASGSSSEAKTFDVEQYDFGDKTGRSDPDELFLYTGDASRTSRRTYGRSRGTLSSMSDFEQALAAQGEISATSGSSSAAIKYGGDDELFLGSSGTRSAASSNTATNRESAVFAPDDVVFDLSGNGFGPLDAYSGQEHSDGGASSALGRPPYPWRNMDVMDEPSSVLSSPSSPSSPIAVHNRFGPNATNYRFSRRSTDTETDRRTPPQQYSAASSGAPSHGGFPLQGTSGFPSVDEWANSPAPWGVRANSTTLEEGVGSSVNQSSVSAARPSTRRLRSLWASMASKAADFTSRSTAAETAGPAAKSLTEASNTRFKPPKRNEQGFIEIDEFV